MIAIENDPKCYKEIQQNWVDVAKELGHEILLFQSLEDFNTDFAKPENINKVILLILLSSDLIKGDLITGLESLRTKYKCDLLLSLFDDPLKPMKATEALPIHNIIYKPFDLTILKEHTRFAINKGQKLKPLFVHTTQANTVIESLKKFKILQLSEFAFKIDKAHKLEINKSYKFYHPLFSDKKNQHAWGRIINSAPDYYELIFCKTNTSVLNQLRRRIATSKQKVRDPNWIGLSENKQTTLKVALLMSDENITQSLQELLTRNFKELSFILSKDLVPKEKIEVDVVITEIAYDVKSLDLQFTKRPMVIRVFEKELERAPLEASFEIEFVQIEKPIDRALLVKIIKLCFPLLQENDEEIQRITIQLDEVTSLAEIINIQEFSEAAISFTDKVPYKLGDIIEIALPQEDENNLQKIRAKVNFVSEKPSSDKEKLYAQQFVLYGMKDEYLKLIRLWALQRHIAKKK